MGAGGLGGSSWLIESDKWILFPHEAQPFHRNLTQKSFSLCQPGNCFSLMLSLLSESVARLQKGFRNKKKEQRGQERQSEWDDFPAIISSERIKLVIVTVTALWWRIKQYSKFRFWYGRHLFLTSNLLQIVCSSAETMETQMTSDLEAVLSCSKGGSFKEFCSVWIQTTSVTCY